MNKYVAVAVLWVALGSTAAAGSPGISRVNGAIYIAAGQYSGGDVSTVNGRIEVASGQSLGDVSTVNGSIVIADKDSVRRVHTVNGRISLGASSAVSLRTVNGAISLAPGAQVSGAVESTNGAVTLGNAAEVAGHLSVTNGRISLAGARVGEGIESVSGDVEIGAGSTVEDGLRVRAGVGVWPDFCRTRFGRLLSNGPCRLPVIVIGPGSVVNGPLSFERDVKLYVSTTARIGPVQGAAVVRYSGDRPPVN